MTFRPTGSCSRCFREWKRAAYRVTPDMLADMAGTKHLKLRLNALPPGPDDDPDAGEVWEGGKALTAFVNFITSPP